MKPKTAEEILKEVYEAYPKEGDWQPFEEAKESIEISTQAMQEYADQEKEAEAIEFGIWCNENVGCQLIVFSPEERKKIYQEFKQQTGGK